MAASAESHNDGGMAMSELVVVGNGPSLLGSRLGSKIDAFRHIVRFNGYRLEGFESDVGTRTTIWSRWYGLPTMQPMEQLDGIWINMPVHERTPEKLKTAISLLGEHHRKVTVVPRLEIAAKLHRDLFGLEYS
jgi:hypothetical protein